MYRVVMNYTKSCYELYKFVKFNFETKEKIKLTPASNSFTSKPWAYGTVVVVLNMVGICERRSKLLFEKLHLTLDPSYFHVDYHSHVVHN